MVGSIQQFVKDKRIIFVGNSVEIMNHKLADFIDSYDIVVKNLLTQSQVTQTTTSTTVTINLTKGQPYSWYIISKSNSTTDTAESEKWKF